MSVRSAKGDRAKPPTIQSAEEPNHSRVRAPKTDSDFEPPLTPKETAQFLRVDALDPPGHLGGGAPRERHQQDPAGVGTLDNQMGDPMGKGVGLSGTRSCDDQQRRRRQSSGSPVLHSTPLLGIEGFEVGGCRLHLGRPFMVGRNNG